MSYLNEPGIVLIDDKKTFRVSKIQIDQDKLKML